jgi:acetoin utilization protein AcuC
VALGGGGYEHVQVVPRAWSHLVGEVVHRPVEPDTDVPAAWRELVRARTGREAPTRMTDGRAPVLRRWSDGHDPDGDLLDRTIDATRRAVFPLHGLDPALDL